MNIELHKEKPSTHSKKSDKCTCDLCGKEMSRRGLFNHMRLAHEFGANEAKEQTRRILQSERTYNYSGITRLLTVSVDQDGNFKITNKIDSEEKLMDLIYVLENQFNIKFFFGNPMKLSNGGMINGGDFSTKYANKYGK